MIITHKNLIKGKRARRQLKRQAWAVNQVWNFCVQTQKSVQRAWKNGLSPKWPSHYNLAKLAAGTSKDLGIHAQTVQCVCERFVRGRDTHRKCPRFRKSNGSKRSLGWVPFQKQSRQITPSSVTYLDNTYRFFGAKRRPLPETAKGGCFVEDARGQWWVCFQIEVTSDIHKASHDAVGIDLGLKSLATLSTGEKFKAPQTYRLWEDKLIIAQRANKASRVKAIHAKIANIRRDHLHKLSTKIAQQYGTIFVGNVSSSQLGRTRMAKSVYDASWSTFRNFLRYKASRHGGKFAEVDEKFSTQICSSCGALPPERPRGIADLGMREWECSSCGAHHDRDVNAAKNILAFGLSAQPLVEGSRVTHGC